MRKLVVLVTLASVAAAPAIAARTPKLSPADRRAVSVLLDRFVVEAVARRDPGAAYDLANAELREGMTRKEWATGNIPVYPYEPRGSHFPWTLQSLVGTRATVELMLQPRNRKLGAVTFILDVTKAKGRWLVADVQPVAAFAPEDAPARISAQRDFQPAGASAGADSGRLSPLWFGLPIGVLVVGLLAIPLFLIVRNRRSVRRIEAEFGRPTTLPPLPRRQA
jgi:hypothetical protein